MRDTGFGPILSFINTLVFIAILGIAIWIGVRIQSLHKAMFGGDGYDSPDRPTMHVYVMDASQDVRVVNIPTVTVVGTATVTVAP